MFLRHGIPALLLAPMEGVTDAPMRAMLTETGAFTLCVSEFCRVSHEIPPAKVFRRHVPELERGARTASGTPVVVQILGGDPEKMARAALTAVTCGAPAVDLNFGCPAKTVNRHDGGATLLKYPHRIQAIVAAVRRALPASVPVSAKLRLGWDDPTAIHRNADAAAAGGADWITIHARTRVQGYQPPVFWAYIGQVRRRLGIPVVANGDIWTLADFHRCREETGAEHYMLGRSAVADPALAVAVSRELGLPCDGSGWVPTGDSPGDWEGLFRRFAELTSGAPPNYTLRRIKQWVSMAYRRGRLPWFERIRGAQTLEALFAVIRSSSPGPSFSGPPDPGLPIGHPRVGSASPAPGIPFPG